MGTPKNTKSDERLSRRRFIRRCATVGVLALAGGGWTSRVKPFWVDYHDFPIAIANLPSSFQGFRIAHLTDLHAGERVPMSHLAGVVDRVNAMKPDMILITGDLVTDNNPDYINPVSDLIGQLKSPTIVTFGNHDYEHQTRHHAPNFRSRVADALETRLRSHNVTVLRNQSVPIEHADGRIVVVGLEDLWSGRFSPQIAFAGLSGNDPTIVMSHNPDTALTLDSYGAGLILAGHTHGGQVRFPLIGAPILPVNDRRFDQGHFQLPRSQLYVSRGVGFLLQVRMMCRPEVPTYVLRSSIQPRTS